ncbi:glutamate-5-semialdehyde dehydrogenase [Lactobacillus sp. AN1001]
MALDLEKMGIAAREAAFKLAQLSTEQKNVILKAMAQALVDNTAAIITANQVDLEKATEMKASFVDRLTLDEARIKDIAEGLKQVAALPDPIGNVDKGWINQDGLQIVQRRVPLGVVGMIYEARPNVTVDAAGLCFKAGNAVILRGGKEALATNIKLTEVLQQVLVENGIAKESIQIITETSHQVAEKFMQLNGYLDVLIPRGSARLIQTVVQKATVPVIETGAGNCHVYVDSQADLAMAEKIVVNAKCQRPSVCNAAETLVVHADVAEEFLPQVANALAKYNVELRGDARTCEILGDAAVPVTERDWDTEYNDYILAVKVVDTLTEAIVHINTHNTKHSEAIVTDSYANGQRFVNEVDASSVYINASTRFTDGFVFGFGAEIGISTQKLHARGPMGLEALTTTKYVISGQGQIR